LRSLIAGGSAGAACCAPTKNGPCFCGAGLQPSIFPARLISSIDRNTAGKMPALRTAHPMTGKRYYLTTIGAWHRHAGRFANSHWLALGTASPGSDSASAQDITPAGTACCAPTEPGVAASEADSTRILVLIEGDEGAHLALEDDAAFEALPHPLAQKPISEAAQAALAVFGVAPGATTFDAAEAVATAHPLLRHRVF
jgi:hypothetical protein